VAASRDGRARPCAGLENDPQVQTRIRLAVEDVLSEVYMADVERRIRVPDLEARARELYKVNQKEFSSRTWSRRSTSW
jgi:hypothetical protein